MVRKTILIILACILAYLPMHATVYASVKVGGAISISLSRGEDYSCSIINLVATWEADNDNVSIIKIGNTDAIVKVYGENDGVSTITCNYIETEYNSLVGDYMPTGSMQTKKWIITVSEDGDDYNDEETTIYLRDSNTHLLFVLDKWSKEATLGDGISENYNALAYPPIGDLYWDSPYDLGYKNLVIPSEITYGGDAYTVTSIAKRAFARTTEISTVTLPETIRSISDEAFYWCVNLSSINIPSKVKSIGTGTFEWCNKLKTIHLPSEISSIGSYAFSDCISLEEINIPGHCTSIGAEAFKWCTSLSKLIIEDGTTPLQIAYCYELGLNNDGTVPKHYRGMFSDCPLKQLYLGRDVEYIYNGMGKCYPPLIEHRYIYYSERFVEEGKKFDEVTIGDNVTVIPESMFKYAKIPNAINIPPRLNTIGDEAFSNGNYSESVLHQSQITFPETLETIGSKAFGGCSLGTIICEGTNPPSLLGDVGCDPLFLVPSGCRSIYIHAENWSAYRIAELTEDVVTINVKTAGSLLDRLLAQDYQLSSIGRLKLKGTLNEYDWANVKNMSVLYDLDISEINLEEIAESQFENSSLIHIVLPNTLKKISEKAFYQSRGLTGVLEIPASCTEIGAKAFSDTGITGLSYESPLHISEFAFSQCISLEELYVKGEGTVVDREGFGSCGLRRMRIGKGVRLEGDAVVSCDYLKEVVIEDGVASLGAYSLSSRIEKVYFEGGVEVMGSSVFDNEYLQEIHISDIGKWCQLPWPNAASHPLYRSSTSNSGPTLYYNGEELVDLEIPKGVESIGDYSFAYCEKIKSVKCNDGLESIGENAFKYCSQLENIQLSSSLKSIGSNAFGYCSALTAIDFPKNLESIGSNAFYECSALTNVDFPESLESIGASSFSNCGNLESIKARWTDPITVTSNVFSNISIDCCLFIPIGTASKYSAAGWSCIPNIQAKGVLFVKANTGGSISCLETTITDSESELLFTPYRTFTIEINPHEGYLLRKVKLNGVNVFSELEDNKLSVEEPEENLSLSVVFANENIAMGDANGDGNINAEDAIDVAKYVIKNSPSTFYDYAADMNDDDVINITDVILIISSFNK